MNRLRTLTSLNDSFLRLREHFLNIEFSTTSRSKLDEQVKQDLSKFNNRGPTSVKIYQENEVDQFTKDMANLEPIVLKKGAKSWECMTKWKPEFLKERYGDTELSLLNPDMKNQSNLTTEDESTNLATIIDCLLSGDTSKYARFSNLMHIHPELKEDVDQEWFKSRRGSLGLGAYYSLFLGAKDTKTNLHAACSHNLFCQVKGRKKWIFISPKFDPIIKPIISRTPYFMSNLDPDAPDLKEYPNFPLIDYKEVILEEGDILFNPGCFWHKVTNLEASIGFGFRWFHPTDSFKLSTTQTLQFLGSTNPTLYRYLTQGTNFSNIIKKGSKS